MSHFFPAYLCYTVKLSRISRLRRWVAEWWLPLCSASRSIQLRQQQLLLLPASSSTVCWHSDTILSSQILLLPFLQLCTFLVFANVMIKRVRYSCWQCLQQEIGLYKDSRAGLKLGLSGSFVTLGVSVSVIRHSCTLIDTQADTMFITSTSSF